MNEQATETTEKPSLWKRTRRWQRWLLVLMLLFLAIIGWVLLDNSVSFKSTSPAEARRSVDKSYEAARDWVLLRQDDISGRNANEALVYMIRHMTEIVAEADTEEPGFEEMLSTYHRTHASKRNVWRRMIDPQAEITTLNQEYLASVSDYLRWTAYALAPDKAPLTDEDFVSMYAPERHHHGSLTHQLFTFLILREQGRSDEKSEALINILCERIAGQAMLDFRVTDLYLQRVAFLLAADRADLVRRRWIERILDHQQEDGGYLTSWHGWGPGVFQIHFKSEKPIAHATIQGLWIMCMLKYRYPDWIKQNFAP